MTSAFIQQPSAAALRAALANRSGDDSPPGAWQAVAAAAGVHGVDAFLCHLSRSITAALGAVSSSAEAARGLLYKTRKNAHIESESHRDELEAGIGAAEHAKICALESELCAVDVALEGWRAAVGAANAALASLEDTELVTHIAELNASLDAAGAMLLALPTTTVELPFVGLEVDAPALLAGSSSYGRVLVPRAVTAADLILADASHVVRPGHSFELHFKPDPAHYASQSAAELAMSLDATVAAIRVEASHLTTDGAAPQPLHAACSVDVISRCIVISLDVSFAAPGSASVCIGPITVRGQTATGLSGKLTIQVSCRRCVVESEGVLVCLFSDSSCCSSRAGQEHIFGSPLPLRFFVGPSDLSPEHAWQLQDWLPPGGSRSPSAWEEVYRGTRDGFGGADFHARCDGRARLLVLVKALEGGWLFGGFASAGFMISPSGFTRDPSTFVYSLTNSIGRPEKVESLGTGHELNYNASYSASFGDGAGLVICGNANVLTDSMTYSGTVFAEPASVGLHPMARGWKRGWLAAEVVAWVV